MAEFRLPENSRVRPGKVHKTPGAAKPRTFRIYRFEPDSNENLAPNRSMGMRFDTRRSAIRAGGAIAPGRTLAAIIDKAAFAERSKISVRLSKTTRRLCTISP